MIDFGIGDTNDVQFWLENDKNLPNDRLRPLFGKNYMGLSFLSFDCLAFRSRLGLVLFFSGIFCLAQFFLQFASIFSIFCLAQITGVAKF